MERTVQRKQDLETSSRAWPPPRGALAFATPAAIETLSMAAAQRRPDGSVPESSVRAATALATLAARHEERDAKSAPALDDDDLPDLPA